MTREEALALDYSSSSPAVTSMDGEFNSIQSSADTMVKQAGDSCSIVGTLNSFVNETAASAVALVEASTQRAMQEAFKVVQAVQGKYNELKDKITEEANAKVEEIKSKIQQTIAGSAEESTLLQAMQDAKSVIDSAIGVVSNIKQGIDNAINSIVEAGEQVISKVVDVVKDVNALACKGVTSAIGSVQGAVTPAIDGLRDSIAGGQSSSDALKDIHSDSSAQVAQSAAGGITASADNLGNLAANSGAEFDGAISNIDGIVVPQ